MSDSGRSPLPVPLGAEAASRPTRFAPDATFGKVDDVLVQRLRAVCPVVTSDDGARVEAGRDWWPISAVWALAGTVPALPSVVARPADAAQVAALLRLCHEATVAVTPFAGASGVCGGSLPLAGGVSLDLTGLTGIVQVDQESLQIDVRAGTFGEPLESELRSQHDLTLGHWPQSMALSTVGGWVACRGAGQYSGRYGKIEDMVVGLEVALADGRLIRTGSAAPRAAAGPDLNQLFVGCEGTLGIITECRLRVHPKPPGERRAAFGFDTFEAGLHACRRIMRRGATPAVLRLYDELESARNFDIGDSCTLIVVDEGDPALIDAVMDVVAEESEGAAPLDVELVNRWLEHRSEIPGLEGLVRAGLVADTIEVSGSWRALPDIYRSAVMALGAIDATIVASAHQSHAYPDGACLYFTFAGRPTAEPGDDTAERYYRQAFDAVSAAALRAGGAISHHHGIGINRARFMAEQLGGAMAVLRSVKQALDPRGILNPGKLGLTESGTEAAWPSW